MFGFNFWVLLWTEVFKLTWCTSYHWRYYFIWCSNCPIFGQCRGLSDWVLRPSDMFPGVLEFPCFSGTFCAPDLESAMSPRIGQIFKYSDIEMKRHDGSMLVGRLVFGSVPFSLSSATSMGLKLTLVVALPAALPFFLL